MTGCKDTWGDVVIPDSYGDEKVVEIRNDAFVYCVDLTSVTIPASVTLTDRTSFAGCKDLTVVLCKLNENMTRFLSLGEPVSVVIREGVGSITSYAF